MKLNELISKAVLEYCLAFNGQLVNMDGDAILLGIEKN